jgi:mycothiol system anti-sigma-R factor
MAEPIRPTTKADCQETIEELYAYLDGELSREQRQHVQGHLDGCLDCYSAFDFQAELRIVIAAKCKDDPLPPGLAERVRKCFGDDALDRG